MTSNHQQPTNKSQPILLLGTLAFIYPLKSPQNSKYLTVTDSVTPLHKAIKVSCCEQPEVSLYPILGLKQKHIPIFLWGVFKIYFYFMCIAVLTTYKSVLGYQIPWNWNYRPFQCPCSNCISFFERRKK